MNPSQEYVANLLAELQRLKAKEAETLEKLVNHFESTDHGLHERYMNLDTQVARLEQRVRVLEKGA